MFVRDVFGKSLLENSTALEGTESGAARWALLDGLGSSVATATGAVVTDLVSYSDFGVQGFDTSGWASASGYTGELTDPVMGAVSFYARTYEPGTGSWTTADSWRGRVGEPLTANRYAYVNDNPVTMVDADGYFAMFPQKLFGQRGGVFGKIATAITAVPGASSVVSAVAKVAAGLNAALSAARVGTQRAIGAALPVTRAALSAVRVVSKVLAKVGAGKPSAAVVSRTSDRHRGAPGDGRPEPAWMQCMADPGRELTWAETESLHRVNFSREQGGLSPCPKFRVDLPNEWGTPAGTPWKAIFLGITGIDDAVSCFKGSWSGCAWTAVGAVPVVGKPAKVAQVIKKADDAADALRAADAAADATRAADRLAEATKAADAAADAAKTTTTVAKYNFNFAVSQLAKNGRISAKGLVDLAEAQGWRAVNSATGPLKYIDENGITRLTIKRGSPQAPGSGFPHVEIRDAAGRRVDPLGNLVTRKSPGNHTPITWDLP